MSALGGVLVFFLGTGAAWLAIKVAAAIAEFYRSYKIASVLPGPGLDTVVKYFSAGKKAFKLPAASDAILDAIQTHGPTFKFWSGPVLIVVVTKPCDLEYLFTNKDLLDKSPLYEYLEPLMGKGLVFLNGGTWRKHRKAITPFLHSDILREYVHQFHKKSLILADRIGTASEGGTKTVDLKHHLGLATADMICKTVLATDMATQDSEERRFVRAVPAALKLLLLRVMCPWYMNQSVFKLCSKSYKDYVNTVSVINDFITRVVQKKRENKESGTISQGGRRAFIDLLVNSEEGDKLSDEEMREETKTIVTVASGGTTDTLGFLFQALALRQDIQAEVLREVNAQMEESFGEINESMLTQLHYLDRVVRETLRLFPAIPFMARAVHRDTVLPSGVVVPRGAHLVGCNLATHRDERNFPDALKFDPDRHLTENRSKMHPFAFVPFSAGPRNCIGQRYAMLAIKTVVATVLTRYKIVPGEGSSPEGTPKDIADIRLNLGVTLTGRDGYKVKFIPRDEKTAYATQQNVAPA